MRRDGDRVEWLKAANALRMNGRSDRTAARRAGAMVLPHGVPLAVLRCAADADLCRHTAGLAAAAARADRIALAVLSADRQAIVGAVGTEARAFAIAQRADLARRGGFAPPDPGADDLASELTAATVRIAAVIMMRARGVDAPALLPSEEVALIAATGAGLAATASDAA